MTNVLSDELAGKPAGGGWRITVATFSLGLTSLVTQVVLIREFLSVFYGNELVIGVLFANWMLLTGLGSYLGRFVGTISERSGFLATLLMLVGSIPFLTVFLLRFLKNIVFPVGTMVGLVPIIWSSFILIAPYCVLSGISFTLLSSVAWKSSGKSVGAVYSTEALGSFTGGIIYSLALIFILNTFQSLTALMAFNFALALVVGRDTPRVWGIVWVLSVALIVPSILLNPDVVTKRFLHPGERIVHSRDTPFGNVTVTRQAEQVNFYENSVLLSSTNDASGREEPVHYAMVQRPAPKSVLMVSGALTGAVGEVLKYDVGQLDYVEINPTLIDLAKGYSAALNDRRVTVFNRDARLFVREATTSYDVILLNVPEPSTVQANRYYTAEFFEDVKKIMNRGGVLSFGLLPAVDYQSGDARSINSTMMNTLKSIFHEVLIVPGNKTYFLASDSTLSIGICRLIQQRGINTIFVNKFYLDEDDLSRRSRLIHSSLSIDAPINQDLAPASYYRQIVYWLSYFRANLWPLAIVVAVLLFVVTIRLNSISAGIFTGGFAASSIEILLLFAFQILYGYVYQMLGVIVALFMAGLAVGSHLAKRMFPHPESRTFILIQLEIAVYCFSLPPIVLLLRYVLDLPILVNAAFLLFAFVIAGLIGLEFSVAAMLRRGGAQRVASELYGIDLIGSALGALLAGTYLMPAFGFLAVCVIAGSMSLVSSLATFVGRRSIDGPSV
jgi:spermidine synthase